MRPDDGDRAWREERHRRRMLLMQMEGEINRDQRRVYISWALTIALVGVGLLMMAVS